MKDNMTRADSEVYNFIVGVAMNPQVATAQQVGEGMMGRARPWLVVSSVGIVAAASVAVFYGLKYFRQRAAAVTPIS